MDYPTALFLQDVRCFEGAQQGRLRPITLLVGENSTGKTTFLGCYSVLHQMFALLAMLSERRLITETPDFNEEPFAMGSFRDIVRSGRRAGGRINEFKLGFALEPALHHYHRLTATFCEQGAQPILASLRFQFAEGSFLDLQRTVDDGTAFESPEGTLATINAPLGDTVVMLVTDYPDFYGGISSRFTQLKPILQRLRRFYRPAGAKRTPGARRPHGALPWLPELIPVAPLRSKPKRTYDPVREIATPEGEHIPMLMMRLNRTETARWGSLHDGLVGFGRGAGLFSDLKVKRHGKQMSDPFQLQVKVRSGPQANIMDVGYGISQSLPILVNLMATNGSARDRTFLLQQPEVHLHPRGQAELASLFIESFRSHRNRFLIETHSDYIVDRVRISVRQGLLKAEDVSILYFEPRTPKSSAVNIHNMHLDENGNLEEAPPGYRDFFLKETDKLLGFAD